jgi:hypothetical protein
MRIVKKMRKKQENRMAMKKIETRTKTILKTRKK